MKFQSASAAFAFSRFSLVAILGGACIVSLTAQTWTEFGPEARFAHTGVWDAASKNMIVFGGQDPSTKADLNDVWLVQTSTIKQIVTKKLLPSGTPPAARFGHVAVYNGGNNSMTIFGGGSGNPTPCKNDVWLLQGANGQGVAPAWLPVTPSGTAPAARYHAAAAYDPTTDSMLLFGGNNCTTTYFNDVWVLSNATGVGGSAAWTQLNPSGTAPTARESMTAIYDSVNNIMVMYGGDASGTQDGDVWTLSNANGNGGTPVWTQLSTSGAVPLTRTGQTAIYDSVNNLMTVFGGFHFNVALTDADILTNPNGIGGSPVWSKLTETGTAPGVGYTSAAYDTGAGAMYIFAGSSSATKLAGDNHAFVLSNPNGLGSSAWVRGGPATRYGQSTFYDPVSGSMFIFGGQHALTNTNFSDYWQLENATSSTNMTWFPVTVNGTHPSSRFGQTAQYDSGSNRYMVFGGGQGFPTPCLNDYWVMTGANVNGVNADWQKKTITGTSPAARFHSNSAYDSAGNDLILFGGNNCGSTYYNDVWLLTDANAVATKGLTATWTQLSPTGTAPAARQNAGSFYNSTTKTLTIYGGDAGGTPFSDIWVLSGATSGTPAWTQIVPSNVGPSARTRASTVYDPVNNIMTVFGGYNGTALLTDAWVLSNANGQGGISSWTEIFPTDAAIPREYGSAIYDSVSDQMLIFGGVNSLNPFESDDHTFSLTNTNGQ